MGGSNGSGGGVNGGACICAGGIALSTGTGSSSGSNGGGTLASIVGSGGLMSTGPTTTTTVLLGAKTTAAGIGAATLNDDGTLSNAETLLSSNARFQAISAIAVAQDGVINVADQGEFSTFKRNIISKQITYLQRSFEYLDYSRVTMKTGISVQSSHYSCDAFLDVFRGIFKGYPQNILLFQYPDRGAQQLSSDTANLSSSLVVFFHMCVGLYLCGCVCVCVYGWARQFTFVLHTPTHTHAHTR